MSKLSATTLLVVASSLLSCAGTGTAEPELKPASVAAAPVPAASRTVSLTKEQSSHFQDALTSLAAQAHIAIVAEGAPLHPQLSSAVVSNLTAPMPSSQALTVLGAAYDYDVQRQDSGVFVLTKRYSDPRDLPCVTLDECQASLRDVAHILDTFNPHFQTSIYASGPDTQRDTVVRFFNMLSPDQLAAAQAKTLRYGDLSPTQQAPIWNIIMYQFVQTPFDKTQAELDLLTEASHSRLADRNEYKQEGAYIEVPGLDSSTKYLVSVTGELTTVPVGPDLKPIVLPPPDWLAVAPVETPKPLTLAEAVASLLPIHGQQAVVDKPLQAKPVTVAGLENAAPTRVLEALGVMYGLRISVSDKGAPMLARQAPARPDSLRDIAADVWAALPSSYTRAIESAALPKTAQDVADTSWMPPGGLASNFQERTRLREAVQETQHEIIRRLRLAMQPQLRQRGPDARILVSSLSEEDRGALAVAMMGQTVLDLRSAFSEAPAKKAIDYLDEIDDMTISTVSDEMAHRDGMAIPSLYMSMHHSGPGWSETIGMGGIRYFDLH